MLKFAISGLIKNINFVIDKIRVIKTAFNELLIFVIVIAMSEHNDITLLNYEHTTFFVYYAVNNQIEFNYIRIIKHMNLNINYHKDIINFVEFYEKELNEIKL